MRCEEDMEDLRYLERLKTEEQKILERNQAQQTSRLKILDDYNSLQQKLATLADKTSHDVMIPVGNVAYFPGKLVHTNEITVLLGDNWFVERSTKQACEIVSRRMKLIEDQISSLKREETNLKSYLRFTDAFQNPQIQDDDIKEIKEEVPLHYEPPGKGKSRKAHKAQHGVTPRSVKFSDASLADGKCGGSDDPHPAPRPPGLSHDELFARLDALEKEEQESCRLDGARDIHELMNDVDSDESDRDAESDRMRHVTFDDEGAASRTFRRRAYSLDSDEEDTISHQPSGSTKSSRSYPGSPGGSRKPSESLVAAACSVEWPSVTSPADIYTHFMQRDKSLSEASVHGKSGDEKPLKSILKKDSRSNSSENLKLRPILKTSPDHRPATPEHVMDDMRPILKTPPDTQPGDDEPESPEYCLFEGEPKSILKSNFDGEAREEFSADSRARDTKPRTPEHVGEDGKARPILKNANAQIDSSKRTILKSPEAQRHHVVVGKEKPFVDSKERRPILKHGHEAFSGVVVEREIKADDAQVDQLSSSKPTSRFKASRSNK